MISNSSRDRLPRTLEVNSALRLALGPREIIALMGIILCGCSPIPDQIQYYQVNIEFIYKGKIYHEHWSDRCDRFGRTIWSKWRGFAKALPDGSAVFFQMRDEVCRGNSLTSLLLGPGQDGDLWGTSGAPGGPPAPRDVRIQQIASQNPAAYTTPVVYWLDSARRPQTIELCPLPDCALSPNARIRVLNVSGSRTTSHLVSNPFDEAPGLRSATQGANRFVGYTCWIVPPNAIRPEARRSAGELLSLLRNPTNPGRDRFALLAATLLNQPVAGERQVLPLMNSWVGNEIDSAGITPFDLGVETAFGRLVDYTKPIDEWGHSCRRAGDTVEMGARSNANALISMSLVPLSSKSPIAILESSGNKLDGGPKLGLSVPSDESADNMSTAASGPGGDVYVAEALVLVADNHFTR